MVACPVQGESLAEVLARLDELAPGVPLLALGQTVFWDEPMKALVAQAARASSGRRFVAGVHDTDFFAKLPSGARSKGRFRTVPHNETTTRGLWSAAAEFSTLFGSETVVTRDRLQEAGVPVGRMRRASRASSTARTEAWGWRGSSRSTRVPRSRARSPRSRSSPSWTRTLGWAMDGALAVAPGQESAAAELRARVAEACATGSLADAYERLAPQMLPLRGGRSRRGRDRPDLAPPALQPRDVRSPALLARAPLHRELDPPDRARELRRGVARAQLEPRNEHFRPVRALALRHGRDPVRSRRPRLRAAASSGSGRGGR